MERKTDQTSNRTKAYKGAESSHMIKRIRSHVDKRIKQHLSLTRRIRSQDE